MESTRWRNCVDLQWYMDSLLQFAGYLDTPLRMSTRSYISSEEVFSSLNNSDSRPSNFLFQIARGSGATLSECTFFSKKSTHHSECFFKTDDVRATRQKEPKHIIRALFNKEVGEPFNEESGRFQEKTLKLLVPNSKRLRGYIQMGVLFSSKRYTPREDLTKRYMVSLKKALGRHLFLLDKT